MRENVFATRPPSRKKSRTCCGAGASHRPWWRSTTNTARRPRVPQRWCFSALFAGHLPERRPRHAWLVYLFIRRAGRLPGCRAARSRWVIALLGKLVSPDSLALDPRFGAATAAGSFRAVSCSRPLAVNLEWTILLAEHAGDLFLRATAGGAPFSMTFDAAPPRRGHPGSRPRLGGPPAIGQSRPLVEAFGHRS